MSQLALYRKYRSQTFGDLVGQDHVVRTLQNALAKGTPSQAYLFTGPRGTGKTSTARLLAKAVNCEAGPTSEPCNVCSNCVSITEGTSFDVIELDAASEASVEDVRERLVGLTEYAPTMSRYKVVILDEVHDLSGKAFDALLKTIEEPPPHLIFILATTEFQKVPPTIRSRCQKFEFHRGSPKDVAARLRFVAQAEQIAIDDAALGALSRIADGGYRDALTLLEQAALVANGEPVTQELVYDQLGILPDFLVDKLMQAMRHGDIPALIEGLNEIGRVGRDARTTLDSMLGRLSDLTRAAYGMANEDGTTSAANHEAAQHIGVDQLLALRSALASTHRAIGDVSLPRLWLESELVRISRELNRPVAHVEAAKSTTKPMESVAEPVENGAQQTQTAQREREAPEATTPSANRPTAESRAVVEQASTGDPALDRAIDVWKRTVAALAEPGGSKTLAQKLTATKVVSFDGAKLVVAFERRIELDGVTGGAKANEKLHMIRTALASQGGENWTIDYILEGKSTAPDEAATVELPAEGKRLHDMARDILAGG